MKHKHTTQAVVLLSAMLLFVMAWCSYQNFGTVTYVYRFEQEGRDSDYRFFQYVPGKRVEVTFKGAVQEPAVTTEKLERGTVVMIEGYGLGEETTWQEITLTYYVDLLGLKAESPNLETYWNWISEYPVMARMPLNSDRAASGNRAVIQMEELDVDYQFSYPNLIRALSGVMFGILILFAGLNKHKTQWTKSGRYAEAALEQIRQDQEPEGWADEQKTGRDCFETYIRQIGNYYLIFTLLLVAACILFFPTSRDTQLVFLLTAVCFLVLSFWYIRVSQSCYKRFIGIFTDQCRPQAAVMALTAAYGTRQMVKLRLRSNYSYQSLISIGFFYWGKFEQALAHLELVWEETPGYLKKTAYQLHYHMLRMQCFRLMEDEQAADREREQAEAWLQKHPKQESHVYGKRYRKQERMLSLLETGRYQEAKKLMEEDASADNLRYIQVAGHYDLWKLAVLMKDEEQRKLHEDFIYRYGKEFFFYERIKSEQQ